MKYTTIFFLLSVSVAIISCKAKNNNATDEVIAGTDSSLMQKDHTDVTATTADSNSVMMTTKPADTVTTTTLAKPDPSKKGKKGKVSINMPAAGSGDMTPDKEGYYSNSEILPAFPGGQKAMEKFFDNNIQYPPDASDNGVEGTVNVNFAVDENGKLYSPKVISPRLGYGLEEEALAAFKKMPKWTPGRIKGKNVKTRYTLPVKFQLSE
jgi:TonB family protein